MKNRNYLSAILVVLVCGVMATSCDDAFSEEQFLLSQQQRADQLAAAEEAKEAAEKAAEEAEQAANAAALAAAGVSTAYNVNVHVDNVPVQGVTVMVTNQAGTTTSVTTDANGNVAFTGLAVGGYNVAINSANHSDVSYLVDFGNVEEDIHYERLFDGTIVPLQNSEASKIGLFPLNGAQTATIKGVVEIETDLTNNTPEVPQDITIRANLDDIFNASGSHSFREDGFASNPPSIYVEGSFSFTQGDIGVATVDNTTGEYSMQVPAGTEGTDIKLLIPLVEADQTLAWSQENGEDVGIQFGTQPALFGPDYVTADVTPDISGVMATFSPEPPAAGRGFTPGNFTPQQRGLLISVPNASIDDFPVESDLEAGEYIVFRGNTGSDDYQTTPIITVESDGAHGPDPMVGDTAVVEAWVNWEFDDMYTIETGGDYELQSKVEVHLDLIDENGVIQNTYYIEEYDVGLAGSLPVGEYPLLNVPAQLYTQYVVTDIVIRFEPLGGETTPATGGIERNGEIIQYEILRSGDHYFSIPEITISGGGGSELPSLEITDMAFQYWFDLDNTGNTQGYVVLPEISYEYEESPGVIMTASAIEVFELDSDNIVITPAIQYGSLENILMVNNGDLVYNDDAVFGADPVDGGRIEEFSYAVPKAIVIEPEHEAAAGTIKVNSSGKVTSLTVLKTGKGYTSEFDVSVDLVDGSLAGTGASFELTGFATNAITGEVTWDGSSIKVSEGSGYTDEINIQEEDFTGATTVSLRNGETKIINLNYGSGVRVNDID